MDFRGNRGNTQGQPYDNEHGRPLSMPNRRATGGYKETKFHRVGKGVGFAHMYRLYSEDNITLGEGRGNTFIKFQKK
jgi:hypothetical protein